MNLRAVSLKNFKSFRDEAEIPLGQITYLIGPNASGKSNVLHGLEALSAAITDGSYAPKPGDYFDGDDTREIKLAAVVELSEGERAAIADRIKNKSVAILHGELGDWLFRYLKYEISFAGERTSRKVSMTFTDKAFYEFVSSEQDNGKHKTTVRNVEMILMRSKSLPEPSPRAQALSTTRSMLERIDASLAPRMNDIFSRIARTTAQRRIPDSTPVRESHGMTPDGSDILNELNSLTRGEQQEFDKFMHAISDGSVRTVEPEVSGDKMTLVATEPNLRRRTPRADFSSGQEQMILLGRQLFEAAGSVFVLAEPELHLHARAQKQLRAMLKRASARVQIIVETHSPIFLGTDEGETTLLVTKDEDHSHVTPIRPGGMDVIRRELGIAHHDGLYHENILFVEGRSEHVAFPAFLSAMGRSPSPRTAIFSLGGVGGIRHLRLLLRHFMDDGRRAFVILDGHKTARSSLESLTKDGLLDKNHAMLSGSFEDAFPSDLIVKTVLGMAQKFGHTLNLAPDDLDRQRGAGKDTASILQKHWRESTKHDFSKVDLARSLATLPVGEIPEEIQNALQAAMDYFDRERGEVSGEDHGAEGGSSRGPAPATGEPK